MKAILMTGVSAFAGAVARIVAVAAVWQCTPDPERGLRRRGGCWGWRASWRWRRCVRLRVFERIVS